MDDFKVIARLLAAIRAGEEKPTFSSALVSEAVLQTTTSYRDALAIKLQKAGLIDGLYVVDDVDTLPKPVVMWERSEPSVTLAGLEYIATNVPLRKAMQEIENAAVSLAAQAAANTIHGFMN